MSCALRKPAEQLAVHWLLKKKNVFFFWGGDEFSYAHPPQNGYRYLCENFQGVCYIPEGFHY